MNQKSRRRRLEEFDKIRLGLSGHERRASNRITLNRSACESKPCHRRIMDDAIISLTGYDLVKSVTGAAAAAGC